ncbi:MAG: sugar phosphate isomerase/epimerase family protein [Bryobacteraceae bacterium]
MIEISRRSALQALAAIPLADAETRFAICSETFAGMDFASACKAAARIGYRGIEIEPSHLSPDPAALSSNQRTQIRKTIRDAGIGCVGLHSFLKAPAGLHLTIADAGVRKRSWDYFSHLIDLSADLADEPLMILGSSKQRQAIDGTTPLEAKQRLIDGLRTMAPLAQRRGVKILMEPLAPQLCNVINSLEEALEVVTAVANSAVATMFDCHNTAGEKKPVGALIREYYPHIRHVHLNEMDGQRPGAGNFPFGQVLRTLRELDYRGWLSVEVFNFQPDGETVARQAFQFLKSVDSVY